MKKFLLAVLMCVIPEYAYAVTCTSSGSGNWSDEATWSDVGCGAGHSPVSGDQAIIAAGHTVTIDGNITVGTSPADIWTYSVDIYGTLYWPNHPGGDWVLTLQGSMHIRSGGVFQIADSGTPLNSAHTAEVLFDNVPANQRYIIYMHTGKLYTYGNPDRALDAGTEHRARIASCNPNCNAGAGITVTLDRDVNWPAVAGATSFDGILIGVGGSLTAPAAGDDPEIITTWTSPAADQIGNVTFAENHMVGDIVSNISRNILIHSDSDTYHSYTYPDTMVTSTYDLNWTRFDEMGNTTYGAVTFDNTSGIVGTVSHVSVTNADEHATGGRCFMIASQGWTTFEGNDCFDTRAQIGYQFTGANYSDSQFTIKDCTFTGSSTGVSASAITVNSSLKYLVDGLWASHATTGIDTTTSVVSVSNSLIHFTVNTALNLSRGLAYVSNVEVTVNNNEMRHVTTGNGVYNSVGGTMYFYNNDMDDVAQNCVYIGANMSLYSEANTYDGCNAGDTQDLSAIRFYNAGAGNAGISGTYRGHNEDFGSTTPNHRSNISFYAGSYATNASRRFSGVCSYCKMGAPDNAETCGVMPSDGIYQTGCAANWYAGAYLDDEMYFTMHDKDQSAGTHVGWGPGGMVITRETGTVVDNTLNLKVQPGAATEYAYLKIGSTYVTAGQLLTVKVQLRKDEAQSAGFRPRLALQGNGFIRSVDYDEMSDAINTFEEVTVSGVVVFTGTVDVYVAVRNTLSGVNAYTPVWPPTLEIFADGLSITKA